MKKVIKRYRRHRNPKQEGAQQELTPSSIDHPIQTKLVIGQPGDVYEQEADAMANAVVNQTERPNLQQKKISAVQKMGTEEEEVQTQMAGTEEEEPAQMMEEEEPVQTQEEEDMAQTQMEEEEPVQAQEEEEMAQTQMEEEEPVQAQEEEEMAQTQMEEEEPVQAQEEEGPAQMKKAIDGSTPQEELETDNPAFTKREANSSHSHFHAAPRGLSKQIRKAKGSGRSLPKPVQAEMETALGANFHDVHIHTDPDARKMNKQLHAQAFTHGTDIFFNAGKYNPDTTQGKHLLAHELTHVIQQNQHLNMSGKPEVQASHHEKESRLSTLDVKAICQQAENLFKASHYPQAIRLYSQVLNNAPHNALPKNKVMSILYQLGVSHLQLGRNREAMTYLTQFLAAYPTHDEAKTYYQQAKERA